MSGENTSIDTPTPSEFISEEDRHVLDLIKMKRALAASNVEKIDLQYNNIVLQLTIKYGLKEKDGITEQGAIVRTSQVEGT